MYEDRIKQWKPFRVCYADYTGQLVEHTFTCPNCGGHNVERNGGDSEFFLEGLFRCADCGCTKCDGDSICYYSRCFIRKEIKSQAVQLTLW